MRSEELNLGFCIHIAYQIMGTEFDNNIILNISVCKIVELSITKTKTFLVRRQFFVLVTNYN